MSLVFTPTQLLMQEAIPVTSDLQMRKPRRSQAQQAPGSPYQAGHSAGAAEHWYLPSILPQHQLRDGTTWEQGIIQTPASRCRNYRNPN